MKIVKQRGNNIMDVEIRQEYIKLYPLVKELFDLSYLFLGRLD
jgi:hypothetical protein